MDIAAQPTLWGHAISSGRPVKGISSKRLASGVGCKPAIHFHPLSPSMGGKFSAAKQGGERFVPNRRFLHDTGTRAAKSSVESSSGSPWVIGSLVLYERKDGRVGLGLVQELQGKKNAFVLDGQSQKQVSIQPKQVECVLKGGRYSPADLEAFMQAAAQVSSNEADGDQTQSSGLADAWELAVADGVDSWTLSDLADLVLGDASPKNLYLAYCMLSSDKLYFKASKKDTGGSLANFCYSPNSQEVVQQKQKQLKEQQEADAERARWAEAAKAALAVTKRSQQPTRESWLQGPYAHRVKALEMTALAGDTMKVPPKELALAQESLSLAGINPPSANPQAPTSGGPSLGSPLGDRCFDLLCDLRVLRAHEPLRVSRRGVPLEFSKKLEEAAQALLSSPPEDKCASSRIDLTHLRCYTIDDASTTEVDDGISVTSLDGADLLQGSDTKHAVSGVRIWVHVADPTRWLLGGVGSSELLEEAAARGRSMYFPWGSVPMFPNSLAAGPFSLRDGEVCDALSVACAVDDDGSILDVQVHPSRIAITHKLTYHEADALIASTDAQEQQQGQPDVSADQAAAAAAAVQDRQGEVSSIGQNDLGVQLDMRVLGLATKARRAYRTAAGCIEIPLPEAQVSVPKEDMDNLYPRVNIRRLSQWESASRLMIAEMMILAGEGVGKLGARVGLPLPYRAQPQPSLPTDEIQASTPEGICKGYMFRKCMTKSTVAPTPSRHASLGLSTYVQMTSPIRRYMDIVAHLNLKAYLAGTPLPFSASAIEQLATNAGSDRQRSMGAAERAEEAYWVAEFFRQRKKEGGATEWPATVLGWQRPDLKLASVMLDELGLEVVIKVNVDVNPGDYLMLGLLEARPTEGLLRFYVTDYLLSGGAMAAMQASLQEIADAPLEADESLWPSAISTEDEGDSAAEGGDAGGVRLAEAEAFAASPLPSDDELPPPPSEAEHRAEQNVAT
mmetsp:Transcript_28093/g.75873  ORF Transcript_28093/g.75873 Transcript_28093/m.75873 type:complete len:959 (+) Transcript_28093:112-2988(+)